MEIYRHKFTKKISEKIAEFSLAHNQASLADFKKHWSIFIVTNKHDIDQEMARLQEAGMTADVVDKMFTSARYWYTKKQSKSVKDKSKSYFATTRAFLSAIDAHIQKSGHAMKPSDAFDDFCEHNLETLKNEITLLKTAKLSVDDIRTKIKKTYKNRHFVTKRVTQ
jgi:hypothetical protein